jgi:phage terminase small subunit
MSWGPKGVVLIDSSELTEDEAALVSEVSETTTAAGGSMKVKLHDKLGALEKIGKHLGMFVDKHEHTGAEGQPLTLVVSLAGATEEDDAD